jgi:hypothetical protein
LPPICSPPLAIGGDVGVCIHLLRGTEGSNPSPSTGESTANLTSVSLHDRGGYLCVQSRPVRANSWALPRSRRASCDSRRI